jgi:uncharacterized repeat protein (TIGR01451 family)
MITIARCRSARLCHPSSRGGRRARRGGAILTGLVSLLAVASVRAAPLTAGNVAVYRIGTGTGNLVNTGNPVFLDEYTPAGVLVQSIALPTTAGSGVNQLIASGTSTSEGLLSRAANGSSIVLTGYATNTGGATSLSGTAATAVPRTIGRVDAAGNIDTTTALTDYANANNPRSVASADGTAFWVTGGAGGMRYVAPGGTTSTQLSTTVVNLRQAAIFAGQIYVSCSSGSTVRIGTVGTGLPTTAGQTITNLPGFPTNNSPYAFFLADLSPAAPGLDTLYLADDTTGLQKWCLVSGTWTLLGTVGTAAEAYRGLTATADGGAVTLFAVRRGGSTAAGGGELVSLADASGYNAAFTGTPTLLATAAGNTALRGVTLTPKTAPDLTVSASGPASAGVGAPFSYSLTAANGGSAAASGVTVDFTLPAGVSFSSAQAAGFTVSQASGVVSFTGGSLAAGESKPLTVTVTPDAPGTFILPAWAAVIDAEETISEVDEANNNSPVPVTTLASLVPDLAVTLTAPPQAVKDVAFDYTMNVSNGGLGNATGITVQLTLPAGLTFNSGSGASFSVDHTAGVVTFSGGNVAAGGAVSLTVSVIGSPASPTAYIAPAGAATVDPGNTVEEANETNNTSITDVITLVRIFALPSGIADSYNTSTNLTLTVPAASGLLINDAADSRNIVANSQPANGTVTVNADGSFSYTPAEGFTGTDTFTYTVTDAVRLYQHNLPNLGTIGGALITGDGYGSALVPVPGATDEYYGLTDRGPNVDGLTETSKIFPLPGFTPALRRFKLEGYEAVPQGPAITLKAPDGTPYTGLFNTANPGLDEGFDINGNLLPTDVNGFDPEGLVALADGTFWISDEYGPFITHFDATGLELQRLSPMDGTLPVELARRRSNRGMEGLTITPDGSTLVGMLQSGLEQPDNLEQPGDIPVDPTKVAPVRIVTYTLATGAVHEYLYMLENPNTNNKVVTSEITALSNTTFLVDERDNSFPPSAFKKVFLIDISGATDVGPLSTVAGSVYEGTGTKRGLLLGDKSIEATVGQQNTATATATLAAAGVTPVTKTLHFDLGALLLSLNPAGRLFAHDKIEGVALTNSGNTMLIANDSDFGIDALSNAAPPFTFRAKVSPVTPGVRDRGEILAVDGTRLPAATATVTVTVDVAPAPDISVLNGALATSPPLADGQAAPVAFGPTMLQRSKARTFTVKNTGSSDLTGVSVEIDGPDAAQFLVTTPPGVTVAAGATTTFVVTFTPPALGPFTANMHVRSNDAGEDPFDLVLTSSGVPNTALTSLTITPDALLPVFNPDTLTYFSSYTNDVTSVQVRANVMDVFGNLQVRFNGGTFEDLGSGTQSMPFPLNEGNNRFELRVTAQDGVTTAIYAINVNRAPLAFSSAVRDVFLPNTREGNPAGVTLGGTQFINLGLQGVGRVPANSIDPATGESLGSISDMQISDFINNGDGTWSGTMTTLPDRGFNTTITPPPPAAPINIFSNYAARLNNYTFTFTPYTGAAAITAQDQIALTFTGSTRFTYDHDGDGGTAPVFTTGLLANGGTTLFGTTVPVATGNSTQSDGTVANRLAVDSEGLVLDIRPGKGGTGWVGDEYGPGIYHFNAAKQIDGAVLLPAALIPHSPAGTTNFQADPPLNGRRINQGMEGLCQSPDGTLLFGLLQSATIQDSGSGNQGRTNTRLLVYDISGTDTPTDPIAQYVIQLPRFDADVALPTGTPGLDRAGAQSAVIALNNHQLLVLSRDGNGRGAAGATMFKSVLLVELTGATNFDNQFDGEGAAGKLTSSGDTLKPGITPMTWIEALNMLGKTDPSIADLAKFNINLNTAPGDINSLCEKWEALALVSCQDASNPNDYFLFVGNDNDFGSAAGKYKDASGVIQSYDAGLENDTVVLAWRVRLNPLPDVRVHNGATTATPFITDAQVPPVAAGVVNPGLSVSSTYTIHNSGNSTLVLNDPPVTISGAQAGEFTVAAAPALTTLPPGATTTFTIQFTPSATGARNATVTVGSNAPGDKAAYEFPLRGFGNTPPTVPPQTYARGSGLPLKIKLSTLLGGCSDAEAGTLSLTGTGASAQGASLTLTATHLIYTPVNDNNDDFTYTVSDGQGGSAANTLTVQVVPQTGAFTGATLAPGGALTASFAGIPGLTYTVERSTDLMTWSTFSTVTAPANGLFSITDNDGLSAAFYRLHYNP